MAIKTIVFDLGGVLIDWNPRYVYKDYFAKPEKIEWFLENICTWDWNENQDAGYPLQAATDEKAAEHPEWETEIRAYYGRWEEMLGEAIEGTVEILESTLRNPNLRVYALTNWSAETFPIALRKFDFLHKFEGIVMSGEEKTRKPFPEIYQILTERYDIDPAETVFIDDNLRNCRAAEKMHFKTIHFQSPEDTREKLAAWNVTV